MDMRSRLRSTIPHAADLPIRCVLLQQAIQGCQLLEGPGHQFGCKRTQLDRDFEVLKVPVQFFNELCRGFGAGIDRGRFT